MNEKWSKEIVLDYEKLSVEELALPEFINRHWEKFIPIYRKTAKTYDDADLVINLNEFFQKILRADVRPLFQSDNQLFNYFRTSLRNNILERDYYKPKIPEVSVEELEEEFEGFEVASSENMEKNLVNEIIVDQILDELSKRLSEKQMKAVILLYKKNYSRKEASLELGVPFWTLNDQLYRAKEIILDVIKMFGQENTTK